MTKQLIFIFLTITSLLLHGQVSSRSSDDEAKRQLQGFERIDNYNYNPLSIKQGDNGKYGLIDVSGNLVVAYRYGEIFWKKSTQTFLVCDSTIWDSKQVGVLNSRGMPLLDRVYQVIDFGDGALFLYSKEREKWIILQ